MRSGAGTRRSGEPRHRRLTVPFILALGLLPPVLPAGAQSGLPRPDHVVIVVEENHAYSEIIGSSDAPFINGVLVPQGASLTHFYGSYHPSQPNYLQLFSGSNQGVANDDCPPSPALFSGPSLGGSLLKARLTFKGYAEKLPHAGSTACASPSGLYARRHCPWIEFADVPPALSVPLRRFPTDFSQLPTVAFLIPDLDHDMHNGTIQQADTWLQQNLSGYIAWARSHNSLLIVTWDEDDGGSPPVTSPPANQIATLLIGPMVVPGSSSGTSYTHLDLLRTLEDMYGLPRLGGSAGAAGITGIWQPLATAGCADVWQAGWQPDWIPAFQGIDWMTACTTLVPGGPGGLQPQRANALRIDLRDPGIHFLTTPASPPAETAPSRASDFLCQHGLQAAVNANFFQPCCSPPDAVQPTTLLGLAVSQGSVISPGAAEVTDTGSLALLLTADNQARIRAVTASTPASELSGVWTAVAGGPPRSQAAAFLVRNGVNRSHDCASTNPPETIAARTAAGLSRDRRYLYLLTLDGADGTTRGASFCQEAQWLIQLGADSGFNLDGGGSTTMAVSNGQGGAQIVNAPSSDHRTQCQERYVGTLLGISAGPLQYPVLPSGGPCAAVACPSARARP